MTFSQYVTRMMPLAVLLWVGCSSALLAMDEASIKEKLKLKLNGCDNDNVCCSPCATLPCSVNPICVGNESLPQRDVGKCEDLTSSIAPNLRYRHVAVDYFLESLAGKGCAPCGAAGVDSTAPSDLPSVSLNRVYYPDTDLLSSFGSQWGMNWDIWIKVFPPGSIAGGRPTGVPGWQVLVSQPQPQPIDFFVAVDGAGTGVFADKKSGFFKSLIFYMADNTISVDPTQAVRAQLVTWLGDTFDFEVYEESPGVTLSRLTKYSDRNGNGIVSAWKYAVNDPALTGSLRTKLRIRESLTDAHGRSFHFIYNEAELVQGTYVVTRIDLPNGSSIGYRYGTLPTLWYGTMQGLVGVDYPDGTVSTISGSYDTSISCLKMDFQEPHASEPTSRSKSVWLSTSPWVNPDNSADQQGQIFGRARQVRNAMGDLVFASARAEFPSTDPAYPGQEDRTYYYNQGKMTAIVHHGGDEITARYQRQADGGPLFSITEDWNGWDKIESYVPDAGKLGDKQVLDAVGNMTSYVRDPASDKVLSVAHQDGTVESHTYNAFQQPLTEVDREGRQTAWSYDAAGNLQSKTLAVGTPDAATWTWTYWSLADVDPEQGKPGQMKTSVDARGNITEYFYYPTGFLKRVREPADTLGGPRAERFFVWDAAGRLQSSTDGADRATTYLHDVQNRLVQATYLDGSFESWDYEEVGTWSAAMPWWP